MNLSGQNAAAPPLPAAGHPGAPASATPVHTSGFKALPTDFPGLMLLQPRVFEDRRGTFVKTYHRDCFSELGLDFEPKESFFSCSHRGVLRGMHFQSPPRAYDKVVCCVAGRVLDVSLDLRKGSPTFGRAFSREMGAGGCEMLFIPAGFAHGFLALEERSIMVYQTSQAHSPEHDTGILWSSFGFAWPAQRPTLSARDQCFAAWGDFESPFPFQ
jgi:dTDP-4-dehydrorhamnose 3,5-epimerase